jgi:hypothetical protein
VRGRPRRKRRCRIAARVPGDRALIQDAIDAATSGDTIRVDSGTYFERIDFLGKSISVTGTAAEEGGAIYVVREAGPVIINSSINGNSTQGYGGAIHIDETGHASLINCIL